ncbi:MAG: penicillin-binding protein activator [Gammaproteobacteria bacterium]|jgi:outer membrane PBP1 activator LpoA protein|nr:penicillin-binding protein activator [Gammaproteobacteria bacterium]
MLSRPATARSPGFRFLRLRPRHAALIIALALAGCAAVPPQTGLPGTDSQLLARAEQARERGEHESAAHLYMQLAQQSSELRRDAFLLEAAAVLLDGNQFASAQQVWSGIDRNRLGGALMVRASIVEARLALAQNRVGDALSALENEPTVAVSDAWRAEIHELRARAWLRSGRGLDSARERSLLDPLLRDEETKRANQHQLWQALGSVSDAALQAESGAPTDEFSGWRELALIARAAQSGIADAATMIADWNARHEGHPASREIVELVIALQRQQQVRPTRIAVLLPQSGPAAEWGRAARDGFLAAHYQRDNRAYQPSIRFYDTAGDADQAAAAYRQAIADGAEFVVGPLTRQAVTRVAAERSTTPTLLLNYVESHARTDNRPLFQFGLAPEDEARQVAGRAWLDGHDGALALIPEGEWGQRVLEAFRDDWEALGGTVLEVRTYPAENNDFSEQIRALLDLDDSDRRRSELETALQRRLQFEPYRRRDADFIFMAAFPRQARLIRPQLRFHYAGDLPVYSTSHVFSGRVERSADRDIDGVIFCDMPWILAADDAARRDMERLWPEANGQQIRLHALGADTYELIPALATLRLFRYERFIGRTGTLGLDERNNVFRELRWASFGSGVPHAYD